LHCCGSEDESSASRSKNLRRKKWLVKKKIKKEKMACKKEKYGKNIMFSLGS
jgi:hypothetical protein